MTERLGPLDHDPPDALEPLHDDATIVSGMGGGDDPIVDGVEVETDLEEDPIDQAEPRGTAPNPLGVNELDPTAKDGAWGS